MKTTVIISDYLRNRYPLKRYVKLQEEIQKAFDNSRKQEFSIFITVTIGMSAKNQEPFVKIDNLNGFRHLDILIGLINVALDKSNFEATQDDSNDEQIKIFFE